MNLLSARGFTPINENGCIMIVTDNKDDSSMMEAIAKECGYAGRGSYGWRKKKDPIKNKEEYSNDI